MVIKMIKGLYIHIPFCDQICTYCDFAKLVASDDLKVEYVKALIKEIEYYSDLVEGVETIYIGGGTPSSLDIDLIEGFLHELSIVIDLKNIKEFTFEINPCDLNIQLVKLLKKYHVNRISMGVQALDEGLLKFLGRNHSKEQVIEAINLMKEHNFAINLDFLYAIPGQTLQMLKDDLEFIKTAKPNHISYYSLIVEDKTILNYLISKHKVSDFSSDLARDYADIIDQTLANLGFNKYEISNYAQPGYESRHNLLYWNLEEYLGVGLNASSQYNMIRQKNPRGIRNYIAETKKYALNMHEIEEFKPELEMLLMGLRKTEGVSLKSYQERIKKDVFTVYPLLQKHLDNGLLLVEDGYLKFSQEGIYLSNQVFIDII